MFEILPNWHPVFVHFTIGLLLTSAVLYIGSYFLKKQDTRKTAQKLALWLLWGGAGITILTVASGFWAYATVAHDDPSHLAMKAHRNWALGTVVLFFALAGWTYSFVRKGKMIPFYFPLLLFIGALLIGVTGWKGGDLVYRYGLGVSSLPQNEGEGHSHEKDSSAGENSEPVDPASFDTATPAGAVNAFHTALKAQDGTSALSFLAPDVLIYESGYVERSAEEYASHHLPADMAFASAMSQETLLLTETISGDIATVVSETRTFGTYNDKDYNLEGTETMLLRKIGGQWKITHIHWSSHPVSE